MFHSFDKKIQLYPALAAEHIMLSMAEWANVASTFSYDKKLIISPLNVAIFATSLLGTLYYRLSHYTSLKHVVYLWSDDSVPAQTILCPQSQWVQQVLGKKISYGKVQEDILDSPLAFICDDSFFANNQFWYTHVHYASFLDQKIDFSPLVFSSECDIVSLLDVLEWLFAREDVLVVIADDLRFKIQEDNSTSHILTLKDKQFNRFDVFCLYCDRLSLVPSIMRVELLEKEAITQDKIYQWVLSV